jgi:hypothetical protein
MQHYRDRNIQPLQSFAAWSLGFCSSAIALGLGLSAAAQPLPDITPNHPNRPDVPAVNLDIDGANLVLDAPLQLDILQPEAPPIPDNVVTATTISETGLTMPSLWLVRDQITAWFYDYSDNHENSQDSPNLPLIENWIAYPGSAANVRRIDLIVSTVGWSTLNYLERYTMLTQVGATARDFQYSVRIFNTQAEFQGAYICDFESGRARAPVNAAPSASPNADAPPAVQLPDCEVVLDTFGPGGLRGRTNLLDASPATDPTVP